MPKINYDLAAGVFPSRGRRNSGRIRFQRFDRAADAIRYVAEDLPAAWLPGTVLEIEELRFEGAAIRALYDAPEYPLERAKVSS
jgi:hypothetical protein